MPEPVASAMLQREGVVREALGSKPLETWLETRADREKEDPWYVSLARGHHVGA
jgi:hypothetical protein